MYQLKRYFENLEMDCRINKPSKKQGIIINIGMGGCAGSQQTAPQQINIQMKRLKHQLTSKIQKTGYEAIAQQKVLIEEFKKEKSYRASAAQMAIANEITMKQNKMQIYEIVRCHIQKLIDYNHHLTSIDQGKISLYPSFKAILYSQSILKDSSIDSFCQAIRKNYPDISQAADSQIDSQLMKHHKKSQLPTLSMTNQYLLKLVNQQNLNLEEINKVGHKIQYGI